MEVKVGKKVLPSKLNLLCTTLLFGILTVPQISYATSAGEVKDTSKKAIQIGITSQHAHESWVEEEHRLLEEIEDLENLIDHIQWQQKKFAVYKDDLQKKIAELNEKAKAMETVNMQLLPILEENLEKIQANIAEDIPGNLTERHKSIHHARMILNDYDMGLLDKKADIHKSLKNGEIKTLMLFGEDVENELINKLDFLVVSDVYMTETAKRADVILPSVKIENISGTFTNSENRLQFLNRAIDNANLKAVENILYILSIMLEHKCDYSGIEKLTHEIARNIKGYDVLFDEANEYFIERSEIVSLQDYRRRQVKESSRLTGNSIVDNLNKKLRSEKIV